jgi:hypothetical protein
MKAKTLYAALVILSIVIGIYFFGIAVDKFDKNFLWYFSIVPFFLFFSGLLGLIIQSLSAETKSKMDSLPLILGILYVVLFFIHLYLIVPLICPN